MAAAGTSVMGCCRSWQGPLPAVWTQGSARPTGAPGHNAMPHNTTAKRADCHLIKISLRCHASCSLPTPGLLSARGIKGRETQQQQPMKLITSQVDLIKSLEYCSALSNEPQLKVSCYLTKNEVCAFVKGYKG